MLLEDIIDNTSKLYLDKIVSSFTKNIHKLKEEESRDLIRKNLKDITSSSHIQKKLNFEMLSFHEKALANLIIRFFLLESNFKVNETDFFKLFSKYLSIERTNIRSKNVFININSKKVEIIGALFEVIILDKDITGDEEKILERLRQKFDLTETEFLNVLYHSTKYDLFEKFTDNSINELLKELMNRGLIQYVNKGTEEKYLVMAEEIAGIIAELFNYPLDSKSYSLLFDKTSKTTLQELCKQLMLPSSGSKETMINGLLAQGFSAFKLLENIDKKELTRIAKALKSVNISGTKETIIKNIIKFYFQLETSPIRQTVKFELPDLWAYYSDFASRNYNVLRQLNLIKKDLEIEHLFEELTKYAFRDLGGNELYALKGSNKADGAIKIGDNLMFWDNKSQEKPYEFPNSHHKQFLQYIKQSKIPVSFFLVITTTVINEKAIQTNCIKLSNISGVNIGVIEASTFKKFFDKHNKRKHINPEIFNHIGLLTQDLLEMRYEVLK